MTIAEYPAPKNVSSAGVRTPRGRLLLMSLVVGSVLLGLVFPFPFQGRLWSQLFDLAHAPVFCSLLLGLAGFIHPGSIGLSPRFVHIREVAAAETMLLAGGCLLLGCLGEVLQGFAGRSPSTADLAADAAGVLAGVLWMRSRCMIGGRRTLFTIAALVMLTSAMARPAFGIWGAIQQRSDFPMLASFERHIDLGAWSENRSTIHRTAEWASAGIHSLKLDLLPGKYSGVNMKWPVTDWRGYDRLRWDIHNTNAKSIRLTLKIYDDQHVRAGFDPADRYEMNFVVPPAGVFSLSVELADVAAAPKTRSMRMGQIAGVELFARNLPRAHTLMLDNMRLMNDEDSSPGSSDSVTTARPY